MLKPPRLRRGDTVGIISPSWGGGAAFPHRIERGVRHLESLGFRVRIAPHALNSRGYVSDTPENRAADIHLLFRDPAVRAIVATIGGDHCCHLLPLLDYGLIRAHPTILLGFSDVTVLNVAIWTMTGLVTFNGPALMTEFAEYPRMPEYSEQSMLRALCRAAPIGPLQPAAWWTEEFLDWETKEDLTRARERHTAEGWTWLRGTEPASGRLLGGCLESLQHLRGTPYWPGWEGAILFLETSEERPSPATVDGILMDYENMGVLERLRGLLFARPYGYTPEERRELRDVIAARTGRYGYPVVTDLDCGHTTPLLTLPLGCTATIDPANKRLEITEAAVC